LIQEDVVQDSVEDIGDESYHYIRDDDVLVLDILGEDDVHEETLEIKGQRL
jgi:hypothetical protein